MAEEIKKECKTCDGVKVISNGLPNMFNCEMGGDCSEIEGWTKERCKTCGKTVPCPECMPVANKYYNLFNRELREANIAKREVGKLKTEIKGLKGQIENWYKPYERDAKKYLEILERKKICPDCESVGKVCDCPFG